MDSAGKLPESGEQAARYVRQYCSQREQGRAALTESMRRTLWPSAQVIILCDH